METSETTSTPHAASLSLFWKLDRILQTLLAVELGYLCLLIVGGIVSTILALLDVGSVRSWLLCNAVFMIMGGPLLLAYLGNLTCGLLGLILHIKEKVTGYPGAGHLLNWIFIIATAWLFLFFLLVLAPTLGGPAFID